MRKRQFSGMPDIACKNRFTYNFMIAQIERRVFTPIQTIAVHLRNIERTVDEIRLILIARYQHEGFIN